MFDGIVRTLSNVRHIQDLNKNLIPLGTFDSLGFRYTSEGGAIMVSKDSIIVMKGDKIDGLYFLQGSTMTDAAIVYVLDDPDSDISFCGTRVWVI